MFPRDYNPFNVNLQDSPFCEYLTCLSIGERGALSLASEFIRGACPRLVSLDLSNCRIKTRGLGRLLHGIKIGNLSNLRRLVLKGNDIEPRGVSFIQGVITSATFANLNSLDLRDNELGDIGLEILMKMLAAGEVGALQEVMLHRNKITDLGFTMFMKLIPRVHDAYFPNIVRISLDGNKITPAVKKQFKPYPSYISC
jgi:Leucine-rich repeat (LRR) protein